MPAASASPAPTDGAPGVFSDFINRPAALSRVVTTVPLPRRQIVQKQSKVVSRVTSTASVTVGGGHRVRGVATWYCLPGVSTCTSGYSSSGLYAAAGSELRVGNWRGRFVKVCGNGKCIVVKLIDWCACGGSHVIDLYHGAFSQLASPSSGGLTVTITW
jgi:rare lipoprotein A (peptidoglycan hydrolase)